MIIEISARIYKALKFVPMKKHFVNLSRTIESYMKELTFFEF